MEKGGYRLPLKKVYIENLDKKILNQEFLSDINSLIKPDEKYDPHDAYKIVKEKNLENL